MQNVKAEDDRCLYRFEAQTRPWRSRSPEERVRVNVEHFLSGRERRNSRLSVDFALVRRVCSREEGSM